MTEKEKLMDKKPFLNLTSEDIIGKYLDRVKAVRPAGEVVSSL